MRGPLSTASMWLSEKCHCATLPCLVCLARLARLDFPRLIGVKSCPFVAHKPVGEKRTRQRTGGVPVNHLGSFRRAELRAMLPPDCRNIHQVWQIRLRVRMATFADGIVPWYHR